MIDSLAELSGTWIKSSETLTNITRTNICKREQTLLVLFPITHTGI